MSRAKWVTENNYDKSKTELVFINHLEDNGFKITGYRIYSTKTDYRIEKDGIVLEFPMYNSNNSAERGDLCWKVFKDSYDCKKKLIELGLA